MELKKTQKLFLSLAPIIAVSTLIGGLTGMFFGWLLNRVEIKFPFLNFLVIASSVFWLSFTF